jgi:hypothetical protein
MSNAPDREGAQLKMVPPPWRQKRARLLKFRRDLAAAVAGNACAAGYGPMVSALSGIVVIIELANEKMRADRASVKKLARAGTVPAAGVDREMERQAEVVWAAALNASVITWNEFSKQAQAEFAEFLEHNGNFH